MPRRLTKSRFRLAAECPSKLFYSGNADYYDAHAGDRFLKALAEGGFQVEALARSYFPEGIEVEERDEDAAVARTETLLQAPNAVVFEGTFRFGDCLMRADIIEKRGDSVWLYEVKAKSFDTRESDPFLNKAALQNGETRIRGAWRPYLLDIAFQTHLLRSLHPEWRVEPSLILANKRARAAVDGINQLFVVNRSEGKPRIARKRDIPVEALAFPLVAVVCVAREVELLLTGERYGIRPGLAGTELTFAEVVAYFAEAYVANRRLESPIGSHCKHCQFTADPSGRKASGFAQCWAEPLRRHPDFTPILEIWYLGRQADSLIRAGKHFIEQLGPGDLELRTAESGTVGLSLNERQWLQVEKKSRRDETPYCDRAGLAAEMRTWTFPLHFIDFETTRVAIPFHRGRRPYEQVAFQFSHHLMHADGTVEHRGQFLNRERGKFPNFDFLRALRGELEEDSGTIFRYATHENSVLVEIHDQLRYSRALEVADRDSLCDWIRTVTFSGKKSPESWSGPRAMVDLLELVKRYYFHPATRGSNSIKALLPAVLQDSAFLQGKYGRPIYGAAGGLRSLNFRNQTWVRRGADGSIRDPYHDLGPIFPPQAGMGERVFGAPGDEGEIADGGAAMMAYASMQFTEMGQEEAGHIAAALLRYCELDTLAMVMVVEYWRDLLSVSARHAA